MMKHRSYSLLILGFVLLALAGLWPERATAQTARGASGSLTTQFAGCSATSCVSLPVAGPYARVAIQVLGTWAGTLTFKCSVDGLNFVAANFLPYASATPASTATANGAWSAVITAQSCRVEFTTAVSGTAVVTIRGAL